MARGERRVRKRERADGARLIRDARRYLQSPRPGQPRAQRKMPEIDDWRFGFVYY